MPSSSMVRLRVIALAINRLPSNWNHSTQGSGDGWEAVVDFVDSYKSKGNKAITVATMHLARDLSSARLR